MSDEKKSFVIYRNWMEMIMALPDETALDLTRTIFAYCLNRDYTPEPTAAAIFDTIEPILESDIDKWYAVRKVRAEAGRLGGEANAKQKQANAKQMLPNAKQMEAKGKQNEAVYVNVNGNVNENVNVNDNVLPTEGTKKEDAIASKKEIITALVAKWNSYTDRGRIPLVKFVSVDSKTGKSVIQRVEERGMDEVLHVIDAVFQSDFLKGYINGWCAKFDWVFLKTNYEKVLNDNFGNNAKPEKKNVVEEQNDLIDGWVKDIRGRSAYGA